jgi:amicyanin
MKKSVIIIISVILLVLIASFVFILVKQKPSKEVVLNEEFDYKILIQNFEFSPPELTIKQGDKILWINLDSAPHTVTSLEGNELDSPILSKQKTYSYIFNTKGGFDYYCTIHPYMKGKIIVE